MRSWRVSDFHIQDVLPSGVSLDDLISLLAGLAILAAVAAIWHGLRPANAFERRIATVATRKNALRQAALDVTRRRDKPTPVGLMHEAVKRLNLLRSKHATEAQHMLARAGLRSRDAMVAYLFARVSLPFVFGLLFAADAYWFPVVPIPPTFRPIAAIAAVLLGFIAPRIYIKNLATKRGQQLQKALPDGLDLMVICAEAGLSLDATLTRVARELGDTWPELAEEFAITAAELTFLPERRTALDNLNARTDLQSVRGVVNTLSQTARFGTPLAQSLRVLAAEFREQRMMRAEERAARLPVLLTVPMIVFILPTLFIVLLGPAALNVMDTFSGR